MWPGNPPKLIKSADRYPSLLIHARRAVLQRKGPARTLKMDAQGPGSMGCRLLFTSQSNGKGMFANEWLALGSWEKRVCQPRQLLRGMGFNSQNSPVLKDAKFGGKPAVDVGLHRTNQNWSPWSPANLIEKILKLAGLAWRWKSWNKELG